MAQDSLPQVGAPVPELKTSPILDTTDLQEAPTPPAFGLPEGVCYFNGESYPAGTYVQSGSEVLQCTEDGVWAYKGDREELAAR